MFGFSKMDKLEGFKYEKEVLELITNVTTSLNQKITMLELQNQQLILQNQQILNELHSVKLQLCDNVEKLEKRITDFTDKWHPIMTENIIRIKNELEKTIKEAERTDINNIKKELIENTINIVNNFKNKEALSCLIDRPVYNESIVKISDIKEYIDEQNDVFEKFFNKKYIKGETGVGWNFYPGKVYKHKIKIVDDNNNILIDGNLNNNNYYGFETPEEFYKPIVINDLNKFELIIKHIPTLRLAFSGQMIPSPGQYVL